MKQALMSLLFAFTFGPGFLGNMLPSQQPALVYDELVYDGTALSGWNEISL